MDFNCFVFFSHFFRVPFSCFFLVFFVFFSCCFSSSFSLFVDVVFGRRLTRRPHEGCYFCFWDFGVMLGWGGGVNVLSSAYSTCCYAAMWGLCWDGVGGWGGVGVLTFCLVRTVHVATLQRSRECLLRYMLLRCRDLLWYPCHVTCCYAALWYPCHVTCCYAAEISCGILATLHVTTLQRSPVVSLPCYMLLRCRDLLWYPCHVTC